MFQNPNIFSDLNFTCSNLLDLRNLQEQVKKAFCYQKLFRPFNIWIDCSSDLKIFANSRPSASKFKSFSHLLEQFFLTIGQNNFDNKMPFLMFSLLNSFHDNNSFYKYSHHFLVLKTIIVVDISDYGSVGLVPLIGIHGGSVTR